MCFRSMVQLTCLVSLFFVASGCSALHVPQSEIMLFEKHRDPEESTQGLSASSSLLRAGFRAYAEDLYQGSGRVWLLERNLWSFTYKRAWNVKRFGAIGAAIGGSGAGLDWTYSVRDKLYITAMGNIQMNYSLIAQHPIVRHRGGGLGLGLYFRSDRHGLTRCEGVVACYVGEHDFIFRVSSVGVRFAHYIDDTNGRLRSRLWLGYSPELEAVVFAVGLGISLKP
ncbi:MAG: hypothetical protein AAF564_10710 [Bacteroidota bacterium]